MKGELICGHDSTICRGPGACMNCKFWKRRSRRFLYDPDGKWPHEREVWTPPGCNFLKQSLDDIVVEVCTLKHRNPTEAELRFEELTKDVYRVLKDLEAKGMIRVITT